MIRPFDQSGVTRGADNISRYGGRPNSLIEMLRATVDRSPRSEAIVEIGGERINYSELWDRAARVAGGLQDQGIGRGDRVAIRLGNGLDWCIAFWGTLMSGAIVVPVNTRFSEPEVEYVINDSGSRFVFLPGQPLPAGAPLVVDALLSPTDVAAIFYTSGTTGFPKGAMTTHENFLSNTETCRRIAPLPMDGSVRALVSVPLFHVTGCNSQLLSSCEGGGATVIMPAFEVQAFLRAINQERINSLTSVPAIHWLAINQPNFSGIDTKGVRWVMYGGAPIAPDLVGRIAEAFPNARVGNGFGLTETSSVATFLPHEFAHVRPDSVGFAAPVVDLDLFEPDSGGVGELLVRAPNVVPGYWNKPEATAQTFVNGWLHPHMHLRGKDYTLTAFYPTGESEVLLKSKFDANWQFGYELDKPLILPKGTHLLGIGHFDNSPNNPANPDPKASVRFRISELGDECRFFQRHCRCKS